MEQKLLERANVSQIIESLTKLVEKHGDMKFFAILPPNLEDNDYTIGVRIHKVTGVKEAFIETTPNMKDVLSKMVDSMVSTSSKGLDRLLDDLTGDTPPPIKLGRLLDDLTGYTLHPIKKEPPKEPPVLYTTVKSNDELDIYSGRIDGSDNSTFFYRITSCGEAIDIFDVNEAKITSLPKNDIGGWEVDKEDIDLINTTLNALPKSS